MDKREEILNSKIDNRFHLMHPFGITHIHEAMSEYSDTVNKSLLDRIDSLNSSLLDLVEKSYARTKELKDRVAELEKENKWISVEEEMPITELHVLVNALGGRMFTAYWDGNNFNCYNPFNEDLEYADECTHWMPLPKPIK